jgi:hypothetical protein
MYVWELLIIFLELKFNQTILQIFLYCNASSLDMCLLVNASAMRIADGIQLGDARFTPKKSGGEEGGVEYRRRILTATLNPKCKPLFDGVMRCARLGPFCAGPKCYSFFNFQAHEPAARDRAGFCVSSNPGFRPRQP